MMRLSEALKYAGLSLLTATGVVGYLYYSQTASAAITYGRADDVGYYDGTQYVTDNHRFVFVDGIPLNYQTVTATAQNFTDDTWNYLNNTGANALIHQQEHDDVRASVLINMMMGVQATDSRYDANPALQRWENGVALAKSLFPAWKQMVFDYQAKGWVNWDQPTTSKLGDVHAYGVGTIKPYGWEGPSAPRGTLHEDFPDVVFAPQPIETQNVIRFSHPNGTTFTIKKWCGNMIGDLKPFPQDWVQNAKIAAQAGTPAPSTLSGGTNRVMSFNGFATNDTGTTISVGGTLSAWVDINSVATKISLTPVDPAPFTLIAPGGSSPPVSFSYTIPAVAGAGTQFCFYTTVTPRTSSGDTSTSTKLCYTIAYTSYPAIQGTNGDIQAGGAICGQLPTSTGGSVVGNSNAPSVGDYVVAGSSTLQNFNSNAGAAPNNLLLSPIGGYARSCRPDLLAVANAGKTSAMADISTITSMDLGLYTGTGMPEVYFWNGGGTLEVFGIIKSKVTIVAPLGNVRIKGNVTLSTTTYYPRDAHTLGIIARGNIDISAAVARVDAFLFSNGNINTCVEANSSCSAKLTVNGFLMGKNVLFNRLGASGAQGAQISEKISLLPQLYLNPPKFFDVNEQSGLQPQGEQPPLY